jgi:hypothetical protein
MAALSLSLENRKDAVGRTVTQDGGPEERKRVEENARLAEKLIAFCLDHWDNEFVVELADELQAQRAMLEDR